MGRFRFGAALLFGCLLGYRPVMADTAILRSKPALLRMSYEVLDVGPDETMGLAGVNYLVNINSDWYLAPRVMVRCRVSAADSLRGALPPGSVNDSPQNGLSMRACSSAAAAAARRRKAGDSCSALIWASVGMWVA
jgi:hypothetical protein